MMDLTQCGPYAADEFGRWHRLAAQRTEDLLALMDDLNVTNLDTPYVKFARSADDAREKWSMRK